MVGFALPRMPSRARALGCKDLTVEQLNQLKLVLKEALPNGPSAEIDEGDVSVRGNEFIVRVRCDTYPEAMYDFMSALADAEIKMRDQGFRVRLVPEIKQRMLVVGTPNGKPPIAYLSTDGAEYDDLARILDVPVSLLMPMVFAGYAYDNDDDLAQAIKEAKRENPTADFSRILHG